MFTLNVVVLMGDFHLNLCHELVEIMSDLDDLANEFIIKKRANYKMKFFESRQIQRTIYIVIRKKNTMQFHWRMNQQIIWSNFCRYFVSSQIRSGVCQTIDQSPLATVIFVTLQLSIVCLQCFLLNMMNQWFRITRKTILVHSLCNLSFGTSRILHDLNG